MRIPIYSSYIENREKQVKLKEREVKANEKALRQNQEIIKQKKELSKNILAMTGPIQSLNSELYTETGGYKSGRWDLPIETLRRQSRITYWESTEAQTLIDRWKQIVVGKGLTLQWLPAWDMIPSAPRDSTARNDLVKNVEMRWRIYSSSKKSHYLQESKINELVSRAFFNYLYDGEFFVVFRYQINGGRNPLSIEIIAPESIKATTSQALAGNYITDGIEYNNKRIAVAYHICDLDTGKSVRVPAKGARSGRTFVLHIYNKVNERQRRGVPLLTGVITELTKIADAKAIEIQAMVINALFAVWVKPPEDKDGEPTFKGKVGKKTIGQQAREAADLPGYNSKLENANFHDGGIIIDSLPAGHEVQSFDTKRPNINIEAFVNFVKKGIYSSKGMSHAVADYTFAQQFSAARGELIVLYEKVMEYRELVPSELLNEIFTMWLWGEVDNGIVNLQGYNNSEIRDAWSFARWNGSPKPDIDPKKTAEAAQIDRDEGWKTNTQITAERGGGDFDENVIRLAAENQLIRDAREPLVKQSKTTYSNTETKSESVSTTTGG